MVQTSPYLSQRQISPHPSTVKLCQVDLVQRVLVVVTHLLVLVLLDLVQRVLVVVRHNPLIS
jgi:hypothetical protein